MQKQIECTKIKSKDDVQFTWINSNVDYSSIDISKFLNEEGNVDLDIMLEQIRQDLISSYEKSSEWQSNAILYSYKTD